MVLKNKSVVASEIAKFSNYENVTFKVCAMTMKRFEMDQSNLIDGVEPVDDGILEIVDKQTQGWSYIKEAN